MIWEEKIGGKLSPARFLPLLNKVASARRGTTSNATTLVLNNNNNNNNNSKTYIAALISLLLSVHQRLKKKTNKQTGVYHCFYLVLVTMQFSTADEASV